MVVDYLSMSSVTFCAGSCAHVSLQRMDAGLPPHDARECDFIRAQTKEAIRVFARLRVPPVEGESELLGPSYLSRPMECRSCFAKALMANFRFSSNEV